MPTGFKDAPRGEARAARAKTTSLAVGGAVVAAAIAALVAYGSAGGARDVSTTATVTKSPPTEHPAVTEPTRPSLLPTQTPPK